MPFPPFGASITRRTASYIGDNQLFPWWFRELPKLRLAEGMPEEVISPVPGKISALVVQNRGFRGGQGRGATSISSTPIGQRHFYGLARALCGNWDSNR